jgi:phage protein D
MTDRSSPVFYVRVRGTAPFIGKSGEANVTVARLEHQLRQAQYVVDKYETAASVPGVDQSVIDLYDKASADVIAWQARLDAARAVAAEQEPPLPNTSQEDDADATEDITDRVITFVYEDDEKKTDVVKVTLDNRDLAFFESNIMDKGTVLVVSWGYAGNMAPPREAVVQKVSGALQLTVEAQDKGVLLHKLSKTRVFEGKTRSAVVEEIADEHGYGVDRRSIQSTTVTYDVIAQGGQTDAQFLKKLADREGFEFYVDHDGLHWHERRLDQKPVRLLQYYLPPSVGDIMSFNIDNDVNAKPGKVTVRGRNPIERTDTETTADDSNTPRTTLAAEPEVSAAPQLTEIVNPRTGETRTVYRTADTAPTGTPGSAVTPASTGSAEVRPTTEITQQGAQREAQAVFRRTQQTSVNMSLKIVGDPGIAAKSVIEVTGLGKRLSGKYYVTSIKHSLGSGYSCDIKVKSDGTNRRRGGSTGRRPDTAANQNTQSLLGIAAGAVAAAADSGGLLGIAAGAVADTPALTAVEVVDPRTGETHTEYRNLGGQSATGSQ